MKFRRLLTALGLLGLGLIVLHNLHDLDQFGRALSRVHWYVVPLLLGVQLGSYYCNARFYQTFFAVSGQNVGLRKLYEISLAINFANQAIPAGGLAGTSYLAEAVRPEGTTGTATLAQLGRYIFTFLSFFLVLGMGFVLLFFGTGLGQISVRLIVFIMLLILVTALVLILVFSERSRLEQLLLPVISTVNRLGRRLLRRSRPIVQPATVDRFLTELYHAYHQLLHNRRVWPRLFQWALGGNTAEVATVYTVFIGFGLWPNPGVVITAYTLAIMASILGFLTNGIGVYEAGMIGTLTALGLPFATALAIVMCYRGLSLGLFLPVGFVFYRKHLRRAASTK